MLKRVHRTDYITFNIELVKAVEKHPCIYNYNLKEYCNRELVQETWENIAKKFNCSAKECKDTWTNLRIVFSRNIKKQNMGTNSKKKPYYLLDSMSYLIPFIKTDNLNPKPRRSLEFEPLTDDETSNKDDEEHGQKEDDDDNIMSLREQSAKTINLESEIKEECDSSDEILTEQFPSKQFQKKNTKNSDTNNHRISFNCSKSSKTNQESSKHQFLLSLFPDVDDMDDTQFRSFRLEVCKLISNIFTSPKSSK